jgi:hypothetical protein
MISRRGVGVDGFQWLSTGAYGVFFEHSDEVRVTRRTRYLLTSERLSASEGLSSMQLVTNLLRRPWGWTDSFERHIWRHQNCQLDS